MVKRHRRKWPFLLDGICCLFHFYDDLDVSIASRRSERLGNSKTQTPNSNWKEKREKEKRDRKKKKKEGRHLWNAMMYSRVNYKFLFFFVDYTIHDSIPWKIDQQKIRIDGGFCISFFWNFFFCIPSLLVDHRKRAVSLTCLSLRLVALLRSCHITCCVQPADNLKPGTWGPAFWREFALSLSVVFFVRSNCAGLSLTIFPPPFQSFFFVFFLFYSPIFPSTVTLDAKPDKSTSQQALGPFSFLFF